VRHALRQLHAVSVLSLALGIGATASVFSVIYGALLDPFPYRGADRIVQIRLLDPAGRRNYLLLSYRQFELFRRCEAFDGAVALDRWDMASTGDAFAEPVHTAHLSADAFEVLGVPPLAGRGFTTAGAREVVLSDLYWRPKYAGSASAIGQTLELDHEVYRIVGVMPPRFRWANSDVYTPLAATSDPNRVYIVDARLRSGVSREHAEAAVQPLLETFAKETPAHFPVGFHASMRTLAEGTVGDFRRTLFLLFAAVAVLLLLGCANVSVLMLARGTERMHEFAVRAALGASRGRLVLQLLSESMALAGAGGVGGVMLAWAGVRAFAAMMPVGTFPPEALIQVNAPVLLFSTAVAVSSAMLFGVAPALQLSAPLVQDCLRGASHRIAGTRATRSAQGALVGCQVALTVVLLAAAGGVVRGFFALYHTKLGYDPSHVFTAELALPDGSYGSYMARSSFYRAIEKKAAETPGVQSAAVALFPIPPGEPVRQPLEIAGRAAVRGQSVEVQETSGAYFATLAIPVRRGRVWSVDENDRAAHVAVINEEMARQFWPAGDPIGQRIRLPDFVAVTSWMLAAKDSNGWLEVIGVVGDTPNRGLRDAAAAEVYVPYTLVIGDALHLVVRTQGAPLGMARAVRGQIRAVDPGQPVGSPLTAEEYLRSEGWAREQFVASLFLVFAGAALALALFGLYSVVTYATTARAQELGIRVALGAQKRDVVALVLWSAGQTVSIGVLAGVGLSVGLRHWVAADAQMLGGSGVLMVVAATAAAFVPAWRAAEWDPLRSMRAEH